MTVPADADSPVVFCSHASADKAQVKAFAERLRGDGFDAWIDAWEMSAGDNLVARIDEGLERCVAGLIFFSRHTSLWVNTEVCALIHRAVHGLRVIPVLIDDDAPVPTLLKPYLRRHVSEYEAIRDALPQLLGLPLETARLPAAGRPSVATGRPRRNRRAAAPRRRPLSPLGGLLAVATSASRLDVPGLS